jgi:hypothetical protein
MCRFGWDYRGCAVIEPLTQTGGFMFSKTKLLAACTAVAIGLTAFASAGEARTFYYWGWGWQTIPVGYVSYVANPRDRLRVCYWAAEYTDWGVYVGNSYVCSPI